MHKARVRANNYYWNKLYRKLEQEKRGEVMLKYLIILLSDDAVSYCHYETKKNVAKQ